MNGRCENDPLDRAVDVCDSCYGEFCRYCLVFPKGRRHPVCRDCALVLSGVRGTASPPARGERRTVKQRRTELQAAAADEETRRFRFFDDHGEPVEAEPEDAKGRRKRAKRKAKDEPDTVAATGAAPAATAGAAGTTGTGGAGDATAAADADATAFDPRPADRSATPAVARLEELRRRRLAGELPEEPEEPEDEADGEGEPEPEVEVLHPRTAELAAQLRTTYTTPVDDRRNGSERRKPGRPVAGSRTDRRQRPERRTDAVDPPEEAAPATAPMIGEVRVIGGRRAVDGPRPGARATGGDPRVQPATSHGRPPASRAATTPGIPSARLAPPPEAPADRTPAAPIEHRTAPVEAAAAPIQRPAAPVEAPAAPVEAAPRQPRPGELAGPTRGRVDTPGKADTDADGNWIPPILRGLAADAREASTSLPQRRRPPNE